MTDINDIKGKVDIINYSLVYFFALFSIFLYLFYYFLSRFLGNEEKNEEKKEELISEKQKLIDRLLKLLVEDTSDFLSIFSEIFFDFLILIGKKDMRKKTLKEIKYELKDSDLKSVLNGFYYKGFMENGEFSIDEKKSLILSLTKIINQSQI